MVYKVVLVTVKVELTLHLSIIKDSYHKGSTLNDFGPFEQIHHFITEASLPTHPPPPGDMVRPATGHHYRE